MTNSRKSIFFSVHTFNTLGTPFFAPDITKRIQKIGELINSGDYDIVCLQEVFTYYQLLLFKMKLTSYPYIYYQKNLFGPRGGLVIFSKHQLRDKKIFTYSYPADGYIPFYTRLTQPSILSAFVVPYNIKIVTTHLSSDNVHKLSPKSRIYKLIKSQTEEAAMYINRYTKNDESVIFMGDFNIEKGSEFYNQLVHKTKLKNVYDNQDQPLYETKRGKLFFRAPEQRGDYVFTKFLANTIRPYKTGYVFEQPELLSNNKKSYLSDHIGLHCILEVIE